MVWPSAAREEAMAELEEEDDIDVEEVGSNTMWDKLEAYASSRDALRVNIGH